MVFVYYVFGVIALLLIRPWFIDKKNTDWKAGIASLYAGLYLYPVLAIIHAVFCGVICECFELYATRCSPPVTGVIEELNVLLFC